MLEIINRQTTNKDCPFVFSVNGKTAFSIQSKIKTRLDNAAQIAPWRLHDLRRTFVTGMNSINIPPAVVEACVNHISGIRGGVAGVYNQYDYWPERVEAYQALGRPPCGNLRPRQGCNVWSGPMKAHGFSKIFQSNINGLKEFDAQLGASLEEHARIYQASTVVSNLGADALAGRKHRENSALGNYTKSVEYKRYKAEIARKARELKAEKPTRTNGQIAKLLGEWIEEQNSEEDWGCPVSSNPRTLANHVGRWLINEA